MTRPSNHFSLAQTLSYWVQDLDEGAGRQRYVVLEHPAELRQLLEAQFSPQLWADYDGYTPGELLHIVLPPLRRRFNSPEMWRSRQLLLAPERQAAETLSHRLRHQPELGLPRTFSVPVRPDDPLLTYASAREKPGFWQRLLDRWEKQPAAPAEAPVLVPAPQGTQAELLASARVRTLLAELRQNLSLAEQSDDPVWRYHAKAALLEYLPETVHMQGARLGREDDPTFVAALSDIRTIALARADARERDWEANQRFLAEKVRSLKEP